MVRDMVLVKIGVKNSGCCGHGAVEVPGPLGVLIRAGLKREPETFRVFPIEALTFVCQSFGFLCHLDTVSTAGDNRVTLATFICCHLHFCSMISAQSKTA